MKYRIVFKSSFGYPRYVLQRHKFLCFWETLAMEFTDLCVPEKCIRSLEEKKDQFEKANKELQQ